MLERGGWRSLVMLGGHYKGGKGRGDRALGARGTYQLVIVQKRVGSASEE